MRRQAVRLHLALFTVAALFSLNYIISKLAMHAFAPLSFAWLRVAGSAILLTPFIRGPGFDAAAWRSVTLFSILGVVINQTLFLGGLSLTSAHVASILITTIPVFALAIVIISGREKPTAAKIGGIALAAAGALLVLGGEGLEGATRSMLGSLMIVGNCLSYALYLVVSKPVMSVLSPTGVIARMFWVGTVLMLPIALPSMYREEWSAIPQGAWIGLGLVIAGPTVGAYAINAWTLRHADSSLVAAYTYVQPVLTTILAATFLRETIRPVVAVAGLMIFMGVWMAGRRVEA